MLAWQIERLRRSHDRSAFSCGNSQLDDFIRKRVSQYEKRRLGRTFVAVQPGSHEVQGYYTLAAGAVSFQHLPQSVASKLPRHPVPVVLLARLAVDHSAQGRGLGEALLMDAFQRCLSFAKELGIHAVEVDAIDEDARSFYERYGFTALLDDSRHLYLPLATIERAFARRKERRR